MLPEGIPRMIEINNTKKIAAHEYSDKDVRPPLSACGNLIKPQHPDFAPRIDDYSNLTLRFKATEPFKTKRRKNENIKTAAIRDKKK